MSTVSRFRRVWSRFRKLPRFYDAKSLRVAPDDQFIKELMIGLGSWSDKELTSFIEQMGHEVPEKKQGSLALVKTARQIVEDVFEVFYDGVGYSCNVATIEEVLNMARTALKKATPAVDDDDDLGLNDDAPATKPVMKRTRKAVPAAPEPTATPAPTKAKKAAGKAEKTAEPKAKVNGKGASGLDTLYVDKYTPVWDALPDGVDTPVILGTRALRGKNQLLIQDFLASRGRKKTTAKMVISDMCATIDERYATEIVSHLINTGSLAVAE